MSETVCCASQSSAETQIACKDEWPGLEPCDQANQCCERDRLYRYTIVTVQRGKAEVLDFGEKLDTDCRSKCAFENWVLAAFVKEHCQKLTEEQIKYLRVYCEELDCWTKPPLEYEEKQLAILDGIRESLDRGRK